VEFLPLQGYYKISTQANYKVSKPQEISFTVQVTKWHGKRNKEKFKYSKKSLVT
jgi:hypothetical protein